MARYVPAIWFIGLGLWFGVRQHPLEVPTVAALVLGGVLLLRTLVSPAPR